ncbi:RhoGAP domain containing protein [Entamoeba marina]
MATANIKSVFDSLKKTTPKGKLVIRDEDQMDVFIEKLGLDVDGVDLYLLGFLGGCKKYQRFYQQEIEKISKKINNKTPIPQQLNQIFEKLDDKEYTKFLGIFKKKQPIPGKENLKVSGPLFLEGRTEMIEIIPQVLESVIQPKLKNPVMEQFVYYLVNIKKRRLLRKDEFQFIPDFLRKYDSMTKVKNNTDDTTFFPILFDDFIEFVQSKK